MIASKEQHKIIQADDEVDWRGPPLARYAIMRDGECYDLNDMFSAPTTLFGLFVRSPWEAGVNAIAFLAFFYSVMVGNVRRDWVVHFKLIHIFFHVFVHSLPQMVEPRYNEAKGVMSQKAPIFQMFCGIAFGTARYIVLLTYVYRFNPYLGLVQLAAFIGLTKFRSFGENMKHVMSYGIITYACLYLREDIQPHAYAGIVIGFMLQLAGSVGHWLDGVLLGWTGKVWDRTSDRKLVSYHMLADTGNVLFLIFADVQA